MLPLYVFKFGVVNLAVMLFVHMIHLLYYVFSIGHKLTHRV